MRGLNWVVGRQVAAPAGRRIMDNGEWTMITFQIFQNKAEDIDMYVKEFYNEDRKDTEKGEEIWKF